MYEVYIKHLKVSKEKIIFHLSFKEKKTNFKPHEYLRVVNSYCSGVELLNFFSKLKVVIFPR